MLDTRKRLKWFLLSRSMRKLTRDLWFFKSNSHASNFLFLFWLQEMTRVRPHLVILILQQCKKQALESLEITSNGSTRTGIPLGSMPPNMKIPRLPAFSESIHKYKRKYCKRVQKKLWKSTSGSKEKKFSTTYVDRKIPFKDWMTFTFGKIWFCGPKIHRRGTVTTWSISNTTAKALIRKHPNIV